MNTIRILWLRLRLWRQHRYIESMEWARSVAQTDAWHLGNRIATENLVAIEMRNALNRLEMPTLNTKEMV